MPDGVRARTTPLGAGELRSAGRAFLGEPREVLELLPVGAVDERAEDRPHQCVEPVGRVVRAFDRLRVHDLGAGAVGFDVVPMGEVRLPALTALAFEAGSVSIVNRVGREASMTTERSWNVLLSAAPLEVNVVPTVAVPAGASSSSSLKVSLLARSPDHSRCARRSAIVSYTTSGDAFEVADVWVRSGRKGRAIAARA